jgi:uncharacterized protein YyaL (SSP411 family)
MNRLADETSPYLLQHATNPVDWHPWGAEALERAVREDKPLFISIGYAACHWCHVMAHESFEDPAVASLINRAYIPIKIDREERPDLDQIYMAATQAATGHGGWPMTVFATPDGRPFFAGTYFPPNDRGGQPVFSRVLLSLEDAWEHQRELVEEQANSLRDAVEKEATYFDTLSARSTSVPLDHRRALASLVEDLAKRFDHDDGGFGSAPKFPRPSYIDACLIHSIKTDDDESLAMATITLDAMASGGIYDHLAGGFARYSVDRSWLVPHFEKMLTDQALLIPSYLLAHQLTRDPSYAQVVRETIDFVLSELLLESGGYASSVDADADGHEGSHAVFTPQQVAQALDGAPGVLRAEEACALFGVTDEGTFEGGASVLARRRDRSLVRSPQEEATREALLRARRARVQPGLDDKVLLEWNAMFASALALAARILPDEQWTGAAQDLVLFLDGQLSGPTGRLHRSLRAGSLNHLAMLGDYAWLIESMTRLFELDGDGRWLERASRRAEEMIDLFWDGERPTVEDPNVGSGFFTTGRDAEALLVRAKDLFDGAMPSATASATTALARLALLTGDQDLSAIAERTLRLASTVLADHPSAVPDLIASLGWTSESVEIAIPGSPGALADAVQGIALPFGVVAHGVDARCGLLRGRSEGWAYVCRHGSCDLPVDDVGRLVEQVRAAVTT